MDSSSCRGTRISNNCRPSPVRPRRSSGRGWRTRPRGPCRRPCSPIARRYPMRWSRTGWPAWNRAASDGLSGFAPLAGGGIGQVRRLPVPGREARCGAADARPFLGAPWCSWRLGGWPRWMALAAAWRNRRNRDGDGAPRGLSARRRSSGVAAAIGARITPSRRRRRCMGRVGRCMRGCPCPKCRQLQAGVPAARAVLPSKPWGPMPKPVSASTLPAPALPMPASVPSRP